MQDLEDIAIIIFIAVAYLASVYFAVAALAPVWAYQAGLVAMIGALVAYRLLDAAGMSRSGLPMGLLLFMPLICVGAGIIWWALRLLGRLEIR